MAGGIEQGRFPVRGGPDELAGDAADGRVGLGRPLDLLDATGLEGASGLSRRTYGAVERRISSLAARAKPTFSAARTTDAPSRSTSATDRSVEALSQTRTSVGGRVWRSSALRHRSMWASLLYVMMQIETLLVTWNLADVGAIRPGGAGARSGARLSSRDDEPRNGNGAVCRAPPHEAARVVVDDDDLVRVASLAGENRVEAASQRGAGVPVHDDDRKMVYGSLDRNVSLGAVACAPTATGLS